MLGFLILIIFLFESGLATNDTMFEQKFVSESEKNKWLFGFKNYQNGMNWQDMMNGRRELCHGMIIRDRKMVNGEYCWGNGVIKAHESWNDDGFRVSAKRVLWKNKEKVICLEWANFL